LRLIERALRAVRQFETNEGVERIRLGLSVKLDQLNFAKNEEVRVNDLLRN
jgi:hypothetical protein